MESDAASVSRIADLGHRLETVDDLRRLGQALWMCVGTPVQPASLSWAIALLGRDGVDVLWSALVEQRVVTPPRFAVGATALASFLGRLSVEQTAGVHEDGQLVWTLPAGVVCEGVQSGGYAAAARTLIAGAQRTVTLVSPYLEAKGIGLLSGELLEALHRGVAATVVTHDADDLSSVVSAALENLRRDTTGMAGSLTVYSSAVVGVLLHPKLLVVDSKLALLGSANFTGHGLSKNFEAGTTLGPIAAGEIERVVRAVITSGFVTCSFVAGLIA